MSSKVLTYIAIGAIALFVGGNYISAANYGNRTEQALLTKVENNQNIYAQGTQAVMEIAQVPDMYLDAVSRVTKDAIEGRYGENGSRAVFQMLQEQNPTLNPAMYDRIQAKILDFRNEFKTNQSEMLSMRQAYKTSLGNVWGGMWLKFAGYPKTDLKQFDIVTTEKAAQAFKTHRDTGIQLRQQPQR